VIPTASLRHEAAGQREYRALERAEDGFLRLRVTCAGALDRAGSKVVIGE